MADDLQEEEWLYGETVTKIEATSILPQTDENDSEMVDPERAEEGGEGAQVEGDNTLEGSVLAETSDNLETSRDEAVIKEEAGEGANEDGAVSEEDEEEDSDDDDDGVQVVIGDIKAPVAAPPPTFSSTKRPPGPPPDKKGKFAVEDFEGTGTINGVPAQDFSLDAIEEKPWRKPGADITDYFNYGFTEETWRAYCDRQKRLRYESGSALPPPGERERKHQHQGPVVTSIPTVGSDKYGGPPNIIFPKKFGMHDRGPKEPQRINRVREEPRENTIQVMTADRREYSRKAFDMPPIPPPFDMSVPPPSYPPPDQYHGGGGDFFNHPPPQYYREEQHVDYEEQQWMDSAWDANMSGPGPSGATTVIPLNPVSNLPPPPGDDDGKRSPSVGGKDDKP